MHIHIRHIVHQVGIAAPLTPDHRRTAVAPPRSLTTHDTTRAWRHYLQERRISPTWWTEEIKQQLRGTMIRRTISLWCRSRAHMHARTQQCIQAHVNNSVYRTYWNNCRIIILMTGILVFEHFKYIGSLKSVDGNYNKDTRSRMAMDNKRMLDVVPFLREQGINKYLNMKLVRSLVWTVLTYGAECWTLHDEIW